MLRCAVKSGYECKGERESSPVMDLDVSRPNREGDRQKRWAEPCVVVKEALRMRRLGTKMRLDLQLRGVFFFEKHGETKRSEKSEVLFDSISLDIPSNIEVTCSTLNGELIDGDSGCRVMWSR